MTADEGQADPEGQGGALATRLRRLRGRVDREGLGKLFGENLQRALRPVVDRIELVYIEHDIPSFEPRLKRRARGTDIVEVTLANLPDWIGLLDQDESSFFREQLASGSRLFIAVRKGQLAGIVGASRRYADERWGVVCEVEPDELILFRVSVMPAFRRGSAGGVMVEGILEQLKTEGLSRAVGVIRSVNRPSLILAENLGYQQYKRERLYLVFSRFHTPVRTVEGRKQVFSGRPQRTTSRANRGQRSGAPPKPDAGQSQ